MEIEIPDYIADKAGLSASEMLEFLALWLHKKGRINGVQGGTILGISESAFHQLVEKHGDIPYVDDRFL